MRYVSSCSFGKDSLAQIVVARETGEPLDENLYCEVMFTPEISAELPEHRDFIHEVAIPKLEREYGVKTTIVRSEMCFTDLFLRINGEGKHAGLIRGFPLPGQCWAQRDLKTRVLDRYRKTWKDDVIQYLGIAIDEPERLARLAPNQVSLLAKYGITEAMATEICKERGLYSPGYQFTDRNGCFFCPNAKLPELRHIYHNHHDLWEMLLELQDQPNRAYPYWQRGRSLFDYDRQFRTEK